MDLPSSMALYCYLLEGVKMGKLYFLCQGTGTPEGNQMVLNSISSNLYQIKIYVEF